ncbi:guanine nucleotide binding protein, alpha subunit [Gymnopilus junonius]|uniref:Guanine nucleotide binding protein, alpha subunit n=1 Tax=Gymnopilus junonius TaxID=109634 RepID=A0A9P5NWP1_GYMJU|nr:guanine nucleotide binding protein, alpha subunit [Gymnopilus junonius]
MQARVARPAPDDSDPLSIQPPIFETLEERTARLARESREKEISDAIDAEIEKSRANERRGPKPIKILLLGQSESGKSTTLKNFQLMYDPKSFRAERASWRAVVQLNVVQSFRNILDAVARIENQEQPSPGSPQSPKRGPLLTPEILGIKLRLQPLADVEKNLIRRITTAGSGQVDPDFRHGSSNVHPSKGTLKEIAINSTIPWKHAFSRLLKSDHRSSFDSADAIDWDDPEDPWAILNQCSQDMIQLWNSPSIKQLLTKKMVRNEDLSEYFLDSLERITAPRYVPTDDDVLHARLKTLGVSEHLFKISTDGSVRDWKVYDVGGQRSLRAAWAPYFDDIDAIIFLAPISCFDQVLEEDHRVNRLEDSFKLWTMIVTNRLLKDTNLILFLNKIDLLRTKLTSGVKLRDYVVSYGDRPNDLDSATAYFKRKFGGILYEKSPSPRVFYCHLTTVTDTKSTKYILSNVRDMLMRQNLMKTNLLA